MIYLILAIIVIVIANIIKVYRQALFIEPYEKVSYTNLTQALAIGNLINVIFPFKIGYIVTVSYTHLTLPTKLEV